jgi:hypothetical protein
VEKLRETYQLGIIFTTLLWLNQNQHGFWHWVYHIGNHHTLSSHFSLPHVALRAGAQYNILPAAM